MGLGANVNWENPVNREEALAEFEEIRREISKISSAANHYP